MPKRLLFLLSSFCLLLLTACGIVNMPGFESAPLDDNSPGWRAWLHDGNGHLVMVAENGEVLRAVTLPLPEAYYISNIVIAPDGNRIAYNSVEAIFVDGVAEIGNGLFDVYDVVRQEIIFGQIFGGAMVDCCSQEIDPILFADTGSAIAYIKTPSEGIQTSWSINTIDLDTKNSEFTIDNTSIPLPEGAINYKPSLITFTEDVVTFSIYVSFFGAGSFYAERTYVWHTTSNIVREIDRFNYYRNLSRFLPTGEIVSVIQTDQNFFEQEFNTLYIYDPINRAQYPFFTSDELNITSVDFINNGQQILIMAVVNNIFSSYLILERNGQILRPLRNIERRAIHSTANGFIYSWIDTEEATVGIRNTTTSLVDYNVDMPFSDRVVWRGEGNWKVVWVDSGATSYGPFRPWAQLAEPVYDEIPPTPAGTPLPPQPFPTPRPLFAPGDFAEVQTVGGEVLYLREAPETSAAILLNLLDRDVVEILGGPVEADGFRWWNVRAEEGTEGWAAQAVDDVTTLLPIVVEDENEE